MAITMLRVLVVVILCLVVTAPSWGYDLYQVSPALSNVPVFETGALPPTCQPAQVLELTVCRGEYESVSFVVDTEVPLQKVQVRLGRLHGPTVLEEAIDVHWLQRVPVSWSVGNVAMPWLLVHDPGMIRLIPGYGVWAASLLDKQMGPAYGIFSAREYKEAFEWWALLQKPLVDAEEFVPGDIERREQLWVTVRVPDEALAGEYQTVITVSPENAPASKLLLKLRVPDFDLLPAKYEYSVYHPTDHIDPPLTDAQLLGDYRLMAAHGLSNPNLYAGPQGGLTGEIRFDRLNHLLDLRDQAGLPKGVPLYLFDGAGMIISDRPLTPAETVRTKEVAEATVAWAKERGYGPVYFMGCDEYSGEALLRERESWEAVRSGGGEIYVAGYNDLIPSMGDLLGCAVIMDPDAMTADYHQWTRTTGETFRGVKTEGMQAGGGYWGSGALLGEPYQSMILAQHSQGHKVFTYMDPVGGAAWPDDQRRCRGLGMYKVGVDGTMTWAWTHYRQPVLGPVGTEIGISTHGFALRGPEAPIALLSLVGFREGVDDARYLATLQAEIAKGGVEAKKAEKWLENVGIRADLDQWRAEMIGWIERLR